MKRKELEFPKLNNYKNEIINLINDDNFLQEFYSILKSPPFSYFFLNEKKYDKYEQFMKDIKISNCQLLKDT